jgi:hypothetical protein
VTSLKLFTFGVQWVVSGPCDVDIGANPSAEGGEDEGVDDTAVKVVDIVDVFRLQVSATTNTSLYQWKIHSSIYFSELNLISKIIILLCIYFFRNNLLLTRSSFLALLRGTLSC